MKDKIGSTSSDFSSRLHSSLWLALIISVFNLSIVKCQWKIYDASTPCICAMFLHNILTSLYSVFVLLGFYFNYKPESVRTEMV